MSDEPAAPAEAAPSDPAPARDVATDEASAPGSSDPHADLEASEGGFDRKFFWALVAVAIATRLVWLLWVHPPWQFVFSDMSKYLERAQDLVEHGFRPGIRPLAWQAWGTHYVLALPLLIFGKKALWAAALVWAGMSAASVPLAYGLACRVATRPAIPKFFGIVMLVWYPHLSNAGYFLSETPFLFFQIWSTYRLVVLVQDGRGAWVAGLASAGAFAIRPQAAMFFVLVLVAWWVGRRRLTHVQPKHLVGVAVPLLLMLGWSLFRFHAHTGYWAGVAENANMNLTAGRCHNIVTQAFQTEAALRHSEATGNTRDGRRVSLPGYRILARRLPDEHPLGLRPALGDTTIRFVGYVGDPQIHRELRAQCYAKTGVLEQVRYSIVNLSLLWFIGHQWPEIELKPEQGRGWLLPPLVGFKHAYQILVWIPSLLGIVLGLRAIRRNPGLCFCAFHLLTSMTVAAVFFGTIRLRMPYDPYAILLATEVWIRAWGRARGWWRRRRRHETAREA